MSEYRAVALEALRNYEVAPKTVGLAAESFNSIFRVTTASGVYALRVGAVLQIHPVGTAAVEAAWHRRLREQGVFVPDVLANVDGELATMVTDERAEHGTRVCILFEWVAGRSLRACMTGPRAARAQAVLDALWQDPPHPPHLVHGDLTPQNVIVSPRHGLVPIDFQDTVRGFEIQDLSITISALRRWPGSDRLVDAFRSGYCEHRAWPDVSPPLLDSLIVARGLQQMNLALNVVNNDGLESYVAGHAGRVRSWMARPAGH